MIKTNQVRAAFVGLMATVALSTLGGVAHAALMRPLTYAQKIIEASGTGSLLVQNQVQFNNEVNADGKPFALREDWILDDDQHMSVTVSGPGFQWHFRYENGVRTQITREGRVVKPAGLEFIEPYFMFRKIERLESTLVHLGVMQQSSFAKHWFALGQEPEGTDPNLRLARIGGGVAVVMGPPAEGVVDTAPAVFIDQDQFVIRKIRFSSQTEMLADRFSVYSRGVTYPKQRQIRFSGKQALVLTTLVQTRPDKKNSSEVAASDSLATSLDRLPSASLRSAVEEFYKRFR